MQRGIVGLLLSVAKYSEQNIARIFLKKSQITIHKGPKKVAILRFLLNKIRGKISQGTPQNRTFCDISQALATLLLLHMHFVVEGTGGDGGRNMHGPILHDHGIRRRGRLKEKWQAIRKKR